MTAPNHDESTGHAADADSPVVRARKTLHAQQPRRRAVATNILIFAAIPSLLFWAMVIMLVEGNLVGAAQLVCVSISAGYVGWSLK